MKVNPYEFLYEDGPTHGMSIYEADEIQSRNKKIIMGMGDSSEDSEKCLHENRTSVCSFADGVKVVHNKCLICRHTWDKTAS